MQEELLDMALTILALLNMASWYASLRESMSKKSTSSLHSSNVEL